jgi:hypothetical protein
MKPLDAKKVPCLSEIVCRLMMRSGLVMKKSGWISAWLAGALASVFLAGCGSRPNNISGTVTYQGVPVTGGSMRFVFDNGQEVVAAIQENGNYATQSRHTGKARVAVETESTKAMESPAMKPPPGAEIAQTELSAVAGVGQYMRIPRKYNDPQVSELTIEVQPGDNKKDFDLVD